MRTLKLTESGDLDLRGGRGPVLVDGAEAAQSELTATFLTNAGEWGYNLAWGVPYTPAIIGRYFDETAAAGILAAAATSCPTVSPVPSGAVTFALDPDTRTLTPTISPVYPIGGGDAFDFTVSL